MFDPLKLLPGFYSKEITGEVLKYLYIKMCVLALFKKQKNRKSLNVQQ